MTRNLARALAFGLGMTLAAVPAYAKGSGHAFGHASARGASHKTTRAKAYHVTAGHVVSSRTKPSHSSTALYPSATLAAALAAASAKH
jgi:hypothetical protein